MSALSILNLCLLTLCGGLGWLAYQQHSAAPLALPQSEPSRAARADAAATPGGEPFRMPPQRNFAALVERPPFSQSRRPLETEVVRETRQAAVRRELKADLIGVVLQPDKRYALIRKAGQKALLRVAQGEQVDGWRVDAIQPDRLVLSSGDDLVELELKDAKASRPRVDRRREGRAKRPPEAAEDLEREARAALRGRRGDAEEDPDSEMDPDEESDAPGQPRDRRD